MIKQVVGPAVDEEIDCGIQSQEEIIEVNCYQLPQWDAIRAITFNLHGGFVVVPVDHFFHIVDKCWE